MMVERAGSALVVRSADADTTGLAFAAVLPPEQSRTAVVVDASAMGALHDLDDQLLGRLSEGLTAPGSPWDVRLVAARTARPGQRGAPPLAARLADLLDVSVVAPDGEMVALRGGELFSAGHRAGWLDFRQGRRPMWTGPRYPAPAWQSDLDGPGGFVAPKTSSVSVTAIPAGLWVRAGERESLPTVDLGYGVPVEPERPVVLVGAPGEPFPEAAELAEFIDALPESLRERAILVPYGRAPESCATLAQDVADRTGAAVRAYGALPFYALDGERRFMVYDDTGRPERLTDAAEEEFRPIAARPRPVPAPPALTVAVEADGTIRPTDRPVRTEKPRASVPATALRTTSATAVPQTHPVLRAADVTLVDRLELPPMEGDGAGAAVSQAPVLSPADMTLVDLAEMPPMERDGDDAGAAMSQVRPDLGPADVTLVDKPKRAPIARGDGAGAPMSQAHPVLSPAEMTLVDRPRPAPTARDGDGEPAARHTGGNAAVPPATTPVREVDEGATTEWEPGCGPALGRDLEEQMPAVEPQVTEASPAGAETDSGYVRATVASTVWRASEPMGAVRRAGVPPVRDAAGSRGGTAAEHGTGRPVAAQQVAGVAPAMREAAGIPASVPRDAGRPAMTGPVTAPTPPAPGASAPLAASRPPVHEAGPAGASVVWPVGQGDDAGAVNPADEMVGGPAGGIGTGASAVWPVDQGDEAGPVHPAGGIGAGTTLAWPVDRESTAEERREFRASIGWRYDAATRAVTKLLAERPGLRGPGATDDALLTDLAAVRVFATCDRADPVGSIGLPGSGQAFTACVVGGLRRLPAVQGVVVVGGPKRDLRPGADIVESVPLVGIADAGAPVDGDVEYLIWSLTARRLDGLADESPDAEVVFPPGTTFRVLATEGQVLLAEMRPGRSGSVRADWAERLHARLSEVAAGRISQGSTS
jgi:hypothetical protein